MHCSFHFLLFLCDIFAEANGYEMRKGIIYCPVVFFEITLVMLNSFLVLFL